MGSSATDLPPAESPSVILTQPTDAEKQRIWTMTQAMWGGALKLNDYLRREEYLATVPLAKSGGVTHWILTESSLQPDGRPILSSCETLRKRAIACRAAADGTADVRDGTAFGIGSVFTDPQYRGKGYASRMMKELGAVLPDWQGHVDSKVNGNKAHEQTAAPSLFSVLYSDIGKNFYAKSGWAPFESSHLAFLPTTTPDRPATDAEKVKHGEAQPIGYHELAELCVADERLLRARIQERAKRLQATGTGPKTCVALVPDLDQMLWHLMREDYMTKHIFGRTPAVRGAVYGVPGQRVWAVWTRGYYGGLQSMEGNHFHILRFVIEDEGSPEDYLEQGFRSIIALAQAEAAEWHSNDVQMWNPSPLLRQVAANSGVKHEFVERDKDSIASLMPHVTKSASDIDWVLNEKFGWC